MDCDVAIIGAGPGGYVAALRGAQGGLSVALIEKDELGGTCLNRGCIPTKTMVRDAELFHDLASGEFAIKAPGGFALDFARFMERKRQVTEELVSGIDHLLQVHGVERMSGVARIVSPGVVEVRADATVSTVRAGSIIIATGSVPAIPPIPGVGAEGVVTSDGLLELDYLPESLVVVGGSVVGIEFASMFHALGVEVAVLGRRSFLKDVEPQLAKRFRSMLTRRGVPVTIGLDFCRIERATDRLLRVHYSKRGRTEYAEGQVVLLATGRRPYSSDLVAEGIGLAMNGHAIAVDDHLRTNVPGIYGIGDCTGGMLLAHVASYEAEVAIDNILGRDRVADLKVVPYCVFCIPEIAGVGLTERGAKEAGLQVKGTRFPFAVNGRALAMGEPEGQVRMVCERDKEGRGARVLGVHIMGPHASDLIAEAALAIRLGANADDIAETIHAHPTVPEALMEAAMAQTRGAIHYQHR